MMNLVVQAGQAVNRRRKWTKVGIVLGLLVILGLTTWQLAWNFLGVLSEARIIPIFVPYI